MTDIPPMGECDVKFTRWGRAYGDMIAHSVDGDFLPIALIEHERNLREVGCPPCTWHVPAPRCDGLPETTL